MPSTRSRDGSFGVCPVRFGAELCDKCRRETSGVDESDVI
ncbi:MAG: hypothetical protein OJF58_002411 [Enhydrobacter sp.]|nr:MAG: hypothetical protein OJF58_002411 [Enhydrobacter sp.]